MVIICLMTKNLWTTLHALIIFDVCLIEYDTQLESHCDVVSIIELTMYH